MANMDSLEKKKKVGIITFHRAHNYGAFLQAYALQKYLQSNGFETEIIDYRCKTIEEEYFFWPSKSILKDYKTANKIIIYIWSLLLYKKRKRRYFSFEEDIKAYMLLSEKVENSDSAVFSKYDAIIFGSDQIWNIDITKGVDSVYWGNIAYGGKKISYAVSLGDNYSIIEKQKENITSLLKEFNRIGVREFSSKLLLNKMNIDAVVDIDPTFLLNSEEWEEIIDRYALNIKCPYVLLYRMKFDDKALCIAKKIAEDNDLKLLEIAASVKSKNLFAMSHLSPIEFVSYLKNASFIVTSSFHGTAFSINFHKKFYSVYSDKSGKSKRIENLLHSVNLDERYISSIDEISNQKIDFEIFEKWRSDNKNICMDINDIFNKASE